MNFRPKPGTGVGFGESGFGDFLDAVTAITTGADDCCRESLTDPAPLYAEIARLKHRIELMETDRVGRDGAAHEPGRGALPVLNTTGG